MKTFCYIKKYDLKNTLLPEIEEDIESKCNNTFLTYRGIKCMSNTQNEDEYIINVVYQYQFKWLKFFMLVLIISLLIFGLLALFFIMGTI